MFSKLREYAKYLLPFTAGVLIYAAITNYDGTMALFSNVTGWISYLLSRFIFGFGLAYILNFCVEAMRRRLKFPRWLGIACSYLVLLGFVAWIVVYIMPLVADSLTQILSLMQQVQPWLTDLLDMLGPADAAMAQSAIDSAAAGLTDWLRGLISYASVESFVRSSTRFVMNTLFGLLISLYALIEKQGLLRVAKNLVRALLPAEKADNLLEFGAESNKVFSRFLGGKLLDSVIVGVVSYVIYAIVGIPMAPFLALVFGVTSLIPYFGPIIGGVITELILICFDPWQALYALIIIVAVQTVDGMLIEPRILGDAVGTGPLLTIIGITVANDLGGLMGILIGIPALAVFKTTVYDKWIARRLAQREEEARGEKEQDAGGEPESPP